MIRERSEKIKVRESLYFIAVIPDQYFQNKVIEIKEYMKEKYGSGHALKSPAHITIHMPFKWRDDRVEKLYQTLIKMAAGRKRFTVELKDFDSFKPRVIFIHVNENEDLYRLYSETVKTTKEKLGLFNSSYKQKGFHAHMTVAFRDLKLSSFREAWEEFKEKKIEHSFEVKSIFLLKHNGKNWDVHKEFRF